MNFWEKITGNDMTKELKRFESRSRKLPAEYQAAWGKIKANLWAHTDFTGRNLMPILDGVLGLLEESAADGQSVQEVFGDDIKVNIPVRRSRSSGELRATLPELQSHLSGVENQSGITFSD
jgi:DNA-binding ferritin-like protein (Dps family)